MDSNEAEVTTPTETKSRWEDYVDVFFSPAELFERRKNQGFGPALWTLLIAGTAFYYILLPAQRMLMRAGIQMSMAQAAAKNPGATMPQMSDKMISIMSLLGGIVVPITYLITIVLAAFVLWLLVRLVGARPSFDRMMLVTTYAAFVMLLGQIVTYVLILAHGPDNLNPLKIGLNAARFVDVDTTPKTLLALLHRLDVFAIWQAIIWGIGVSVVTGISRGRAMAAAFGTWLLAALPGMLLGSLKIGGAAAPK